MLDNHVNDLWLPKATADTPAVLPVSSKGSWIISAVAPFGFASGAYASCFYLVAILNMVHLILTIFIAFGNWNRSRLGIYAADHWQVDIVNIWWLWMTVSSLLGAFALSFA